MLYLVKQNIFVRLDNLIKIKARFDFEYEYIKLLLHGYSLQGKIDK